MPPFILSPVTAADFRRLAEIQRLAFGPDDPLARAALANIAPADLDAWTEHGIAHPNPPPGVRIELVCARDAETGEIGGWARWDIPLAEGEPWAGPAAEKAPLPRGINEEVWKGYFADLAQHKERLLGDRTRWLLMLLVVDPTFHRRGLGSLLVSDGIKRAHALGLPVILTASPAGQRMYPTLGFKVLDTPTMSSAKLQLPIMIKEP